MHESETPAAILATLSPSDARSVQDAWHYSFLVRYLVAHRKRALLRHTWRHPSFFWALIRFLWIDWRWRRALRLRASGAGDGAPRAS